MKNLTIFIVSDSIGETADLVAKAAASQYRSDLETISMKRFSHVEDESQLNEIAYLAQQQDAVIIYTLVKKTMRAKLKEQCEIQQVFSVDLMGPLFEGLGSFLNESPFEEPGLVRQLDDDYFKKIEAIEFAVKYDDGRDPRGITKADIVLVGISRTSKTPLSQYLAHKGYKVANVPLVPEVDPPIELYSVEAGKCFGLVISPDKLNSIRRERLITLGLKDDANYAQVSRIKHEITHFEKVVEKIGCSVIDVTNRAVEETANIILGEISTRYK